MDSIAFCCISTGLFGFPQKEAAQIAVDTIQKWLDDTSSNMTIEFDVFSDNDFSIYKNLTSF